MPEKPEKAEAHEAIISLPDALMTAPPGVYSYTLPAESFPAGKNITEEMKPLINIALATLLGASLTARKPYCVWGDYAGRLLTVADYELDCTFDQTEAVGYTLPETGSRLMASYSIYKTFPTVGSEPLNFWNSSGFTVLNVLLPLMPFLWSIRVLNYDRRLEAEGMGYGYAMRLRSSEGTEEPGPAFQGRSRTPAGALCVTTYAALLHRAKVNRLHGLMYAD